MGQIDRVAASWPRLERALEDAIDRPAGGGWRRFVEWGRQGGRDAAFAPGIYVFTFHSVVDPVHAQPWERAYAKVAISTDEFRTTLDFLARHFMRLRLSEAIALEGQVVDRPYAVVTFDDGYTNTLTQAAPVATEFGFQPALFVNGAFADGSVYYRVLVALLTGKADGHAATTATSDARVSVLRDELSARMSSVEWSRDPAVLFDQTKDGYVRGAIEEAADGAFRKTFGDPAALRVHVTVDQVRALTELGWEIANHTFAHDVLSDLEAEDVAETIERNERYWADRGIPLLPCVAYPNGAAKHVGAGVIEYLDRRLDLNGMFCSGGINRRPQRTEWLRMPVSARFISALGPSISREVVRTDDAANVAQRAAS